ncbi:hypothetical protein H4582DRAFT_2051942 [Lactarius indigo]|nr:hypothetical protein H4582DRAFT_2051942 [Lactarius indigo]
MTTAVTVEAWVSTAKTRNELQKENEELKTELLKMETCLARTNSLIDINNSDHVEVVTGTPATITVWIQRLIVLSKNRRHQILLMYEAGQYQNNVVLLNDYFEHDIQEWKECALLI